MTGIIVLAAGSSSRLGQPKQLVTWHGVPLIRHAATTALTADLGPVTIVLGAVTKPCREALLGLELTIAENPAWADGMGGSISAGIRSLSAHKLENVIVTLCDLPLVTPAVFSRLVSLRKTERTEIVACHNGTAFSPPILFSENRFENLRSLSGRDGAKNILKNETSITRLDCPEAAMDIDTPGDLSDSRSW